MTVLRACVAGALAGAIAGCARAEPGKEMRSDSTAGAALAWNAPASLVRGPTVLFRAPVLAISDSVGYVLSGPPTEPVRPRVGAPSADAGRLLAMRLPDRAIQPPDGPFAFVFPQAAVDRRGVLHVVWAEPAAPAALDTAGDLRLVRLGSLWYATYDGRSWSPPARIYENERIDWEPARASGLALDAAGDPHLAFGGEDREGRWMLIHLRRRGGSWLRTDVRPAAPVVYADLAAGPAGRVAVVYVSSHRDADGFHQNALFTVHSTDGGETWDAHRPLGGPAAWPASEPRIVMGPEGTEHVVWTRNVPGAFDSEGLWHAASADAGRTWSAGAALPLSGVTDGKRAVADRAGAVHVVLVSYRNRRADLLYTRFSAGRWAPLAPVFPGRMGAAPSLRIDGRDRLHLAWIAQPAGVDVPTRPSPGDTIPWFEIAYAAAAPAR